jgi:hypothetical protein
MGAEQLIFSVSAIFIGANFGLAALTHVEKVTSDFHYFYKLFMVALILLSAWLSIFSSCCIFNSICLAEWSMYLLAASYSLLLFLGFIYLLSGKFFNISLKDKIMNGHSIG